MTARVDLHLHTTYSDGVYTPEALVAEAVQRGVDLVIAITDHDEVGGVAPVQAAGARVGLRVISGVEINTEVGRENIHVLGYGIDIASPAMTEGLRTLREQRLTRALRILQRLEALGAPLEEARVLKIAGHGSIGRPHIAKALVEAGYVPDISTAFDRYLARRAPAYVPRAPFRPEAAIALIHRAGGIASLAHPGKLGDPIRIITHLRAAGLDGLEVYHSDHTPAVTRRMAKLAARFGLLPTGGTDSHGPQSPRTVPVGSVPVPDSVGEGVLERLGMNMP